VEIRILGSHCRLDGESIWRDQSDVGQWWIYSTIIIIGLLLYCSK